MIPYGRQTVDEDDIRAVNEVLRGDWLTTGPMVNRFEEALAEYVGAAEAVAVNSGTAALHAMVNALGIGPGDEVIVPTMTFAATANAVVFEGGTPVFVDVEPDTLLIDPPAVEAAITPRTKAIIAVDYAGQPCDYAHLHSLADEAGVALLADGCHALGAAAGGRRVGALAKMTAFSFHPVKPITTGEGGAVTTDDPALAKRMRQFRSHGIDTDARSRHETGAWRYEMQFLGYNYRICDIQCALGLQQLGKLDRWIDRRQEIAVAYDAAFAGCQDVTPLVTAPGVSHGRHLYVVKLTQTPRAAAFDALRAAGIGVNVHYIPVHLHPFYQERFGTAPGLCPVAEQAYEQIISLPVFPTMTDAHVGAVVDAVKQTASVSLPHAA